MKNAPETIYIEPPRALDANPMYFTRKFNDTEISYVRGDIAYEYACEVERLKAQGQYTAAHLIEDMDNLRHMLGARSNDRRGQFGYRNYFCAGASDLPSMLRMESLGLVVRTNRDTFSATAEGCKAIGLTPLQIRRALG